MITICIVRLTLLIVFMVNSVNSSFCSDLVSRGFRFGLFFETRANLTSMSLGGQRYKVDLRRSVKREFLEDISSGLKSYEGRLAKPSFDEFTRGKIVEWYSLESESESVVTRIVSRKWYPSFKDMLLEIGHKKFLPREMLISHAQDVYLSFPGYLENEKKFGVLALELQLISSSLPE